MRDRLVLANLIGALNKLALPSKAQIRYLRELGVYPQIDELALEFDDAYTTIVGYLSERGILLSSDIAYDLSRLITILSKMSKDASKWNVTSLDNEEWSEVRSIATKVIGNIMSNPGSLS